MTDPRFRPNSNDPYDRNPRGDFASGSPADRDPTKMINQPQLTTASGKVWVILGAVVTAICVWMLWMLAQPPTVGLAVFAIVADIVLYACMIAVYFAVPQSRPRLITIAVLYGLIVAITLVVVVVIALSAAAGLANAV